MSGSQLSSPIVSAINIQKQYHQDVEAKLVAYGLEQGISKTITTDIFAKDTIYFSRNRPYKRMPESFNTFCKEHALHSELPKMFSSSIKSDNTLYQHQAQAIESILAEKTTIIATGTGSGKTESFLIPILHHCLQAKNRQQPSIKALILYPLNALANDQIRRILSAVAGKGIRVGCFIGSTPRVRPKNDVEVQKEYCTSRQEMIDNPPDILITNYIMLDRLLTKPGTRSMFINSSTLKYLVVDEIHYFRGTKGANLSLLLRRLRALYQHPIVQIGASGTLRQSGGYFADSAETKIEQFARLIFGQEAIGSNGFQIVEPSFQKDDEQLLDPLSPTEKIAGSTLINTRNKAQATELCKKVFGPAAFEKYEQQHNKETGVRAFPGYYLIQASPFVDEMRKQLTHQATSFSKLTKIFQELFQKCHGHTPEDPKSVVEAYWSLIDYINDGCGDTKPSLAPVLDYRIHLVLNDVSEELTRCLHCGHYHDGRCSRCRHCNGLLFKVSKHHPDQYIAYLTKNELYPNKVGGKQVFPVLVSRDVSMSNEASSPIFLLEEHTSNADEEGYVLQPALEQTFRGITIDFNQNKQDLETLPISDAHIYWHNVFKIIDALVTHEETRISDKLLGFIDNREKASGLKLRLNDDFAERTLTQSATDLWREQGPISLIEAFEILQDALNTEASQLVEQGGERNEVLAELLQEMPFWFQRMLTYIQGEQLNDNPDWKISINQKLELTEVEFELLEKVMLQENAIDRSHFPHRKDLQHFHLDKYRVETQYGVGLRRAAEQGYHITSLGERGILYQEMIQRTGADTIEQMLQDLADKNIIRSRTTPSGDKYYQINPQHIYLEIHKGSSPDIDPDAWKKDFALVECHTADHNEERRTDIEQRFNDTHIQALICTPTLEMGVDIGKLESVLMIGFPPSPANYAQRAGRAGRSGKSRRATIVILSSSDDAHDAYYYAEPGKMIDGEITPPQFTLNNPSLLAAHSFAYLLAGTQQHLLTAKIKNIPQDIQRFLDEDKLHLRETLGNESYQRFGRELYHKSKHILPHLTEQGVHNITLESCYTYNIFPDYGFRNDGLALYDKAKPDHREDQDRFLTAREPEGAPKKLAPGRIVFCGGRAVQVQTVQPSNSYHAEKDPDGNLFRLPRYVVANTEETTQIERLRDPHKVYRVSRTIHIKQPLEELKGAGPLYSRVYFVPESTLYFINEGEIKPDQEELQQLTDTHGEAYRFGMKIVRGGLLVRFSNSILSSTMKTSFLAVLLRNIPDYFDLDDTELRVIQNIKIAHSGQQNENYADFFIYGQDKSGLVPFEGIFEHFNDLLQKALKKLRNCECNGSGCYLCLFSLNSPMLTGRISHADAVNFLAAYLREERLKPALTLKQNSTDHPDIILHIKNQGDDWIFETRHTRTNKQEKHRVPRTNDSNTVLYQELRRLLQQQWEDGARYAQICSKQDYIRNQLGGDYNINKGKQAFFALWLERMRWQNWRVTREEHDNA